MAQSERLAARARRVVRLELIDSAVRIAGDDAARQLAAAIGARHAAFWLVVHSGPGEELGELLRLADEMRGLEQAPVEFVVLTRVPVAAVPGRTFFYDLHPAALLFPQARRINQCRRVQHPAAGGTVARDSHGAALRPAP